MALKRRAAFKWKAENKALKRRAAFKRKAENKATQVAKHASTERVLQNACKRGQLKQKQERPTKNSKLSMVV